MPVILVTNDDGVHSEGINVLYKTLKSLGEVYVVAPDTEQSAVAHSLTLHRPLRAEKLDNKIYAVNGTPTDCVILAVHKLLPQKPALIVSGINNGGNLGDDITYSGTVAAAIEGTLLGIPSIAVSFMIENRSRSTYQSRSLKLKKTANFAKKLASMVLIKGLPLDTFLNVNVPERTKIRGVKLTRQGKNVYDNALHEMLDPKGKTHYWIGGGTPLGEKGQNTDFAAVKDGFISVTPIHLDFTNYNALEYLKNNWKI